MKSSKHWLAGMGLLTAMGLSPLDAGAEESRFLKFRVDLGRIVGKAFQVPGGGTIDFEDIINLQFPSEVVAQDRFYMTNVKSPGVITSMMTPQAVDPLTNPFALDATFGILATATGDETAPAPYCVQDYPVAVFAGNLLGYEMRSGLTLKIGYSPGGSLGPVDHVGANIRISKAQLDVKVDSYHPIRGELTGSRLVGSNETSTNIGVNIDFAKVTIGPEFYFKTPLAEVTRKAIVAGLKGLEETFFRDTKQTWDKKWESHVARVQRAGNNRYVTIHGGRELNICKDDEFEIYNVEYFWPDTDKPCNGTPGTTARYAGKIRITSVGELYSEGQLVDSVEMKIQKGARVMVSKLVPKTIAECRNQ